jgi:hypothetical protein
VKSLVLENMTSRYTAFCIAVLILCFGVWGQSEQSLAENVDSKAADSPDIPCYVEDFVQKLALDQRNEPLSSGKRSLLPYVIYKEIYLKRTRDNFTGLTIRDCQKSRLPGESWPFYGIFKDESDFVRSLKSKMLAQAFYLYERKYASIGRPPIDMADIPAYEERAGRGELDAMYELRRHYDYPYRESFNPELTEARYWMFKAIEAGDEASMLDAGYERPYSVRSELSYDTTTVAIDVACEGIDKSAPVPYPACFLYNFLIGESPGQVGHLVLDLDHLSGFSIRPQIISLKRFDGQVVVELTSFADRSRDRVRRDYFGMDGRYLGSDRPEFTPDFFWNYHGLSASAKSETRAIDLSGESTLDSIHVRTLPYVESFMFWETEFPADERLTALDYIIVEDGGQPDGAADMDEESCRRKEKIFQELEDEEHTYFQRMRKLFRLDPYEALRIDKKETSEVSPLEKGYASWMSLNYPPYLCRYYPPRRLFARSFFQCNADDAFAAYEELEQRPTYVIELGSEVESIRMLQVCRYLGHYSTEDYHRDNPDPCYAVQVRKKTKDGYKYHYAINAIRQQQHGSSYHDSEIHSATKEVKANAMDGNTYFVLFDSLSMRDPIYRGLEFRMDVFDEDHNYLGSNKPELSASVVPGFKRLPDSFAKQVEEWERKNDWSPSYANPEDYHLAYPECGDLIVEQRRNIIRSAKGEN